MIAYSIVGLLDQFSPRLGVNHFKGQRTLDSFCKDIYYWELYSLEDFGTGFTLFLYTFS